jgi:hypothetical protein
VLNNGDEIEIRDPTTGRLRQTLKHATPIEFEAVDVHPNDRSVVSLSVDGVQEWDLMGNQGVIRTYALPEVDEVKAIGYSEVAYDGDGSRIVCYRRGTDVIVVWSTGDCSQPVNRIRLDPAMKVRSLPLDCDREQIAALLTAKHEDDEDEGEDEEEDGDEDGGGEEGKTTVVKSWKIDTGEEINSLQITTEEIDSVCKGEHDASHASLQLEEDLRVEPRRRSHHSGNDNRRTR